MSNEIISAYIEENGIKKKAVCRKLNLTYKGLQNKTDGKTEFTASEVKKLSQWWGVSSDYLLGIETR